MFSNISTLRRVLAIVLSLALLASLGFAVSAVLARKQALMELDKITRWAIEEHQKIRAEYRKINEFYEAFSGRPDQMPDVEIPDTEPELKKESF